MPHPRRPRRRTNRRLVRVSAPRARRVTRSRIAHTARTTNNGRGPNCRAPASRNDARHTTIVAAQRAVPSAAARRRQIASDRAPRRVIRARIAPDGRTTNNGRGAACRAPASRNDARHTTIVAAQRAVPSAAARRRQIASDRAPRRVIRARIAPDGRTTNNGRGAACRAPASRNDARHTTIVAAQRAVPSAAARRRQIASDRAPRRVIRARIAPDGRTTNNGRGAACRAPASRNDARHTTIVAAQRAVPCFVSRGSRPSIAIHGHLAPR